MPDTRMAGTYTVTSAAGHDGGDHHRDGDDVRDDRQQVSQEIVLTYTVTSAA